MYLSYFFPQNGFDAVRSWLRYGCIEDLDAWIPDLESVLDPLLERGDRVLDPAVIHLGQGSLLRG
jgi:hypothetical protein